MLQIYSARHPTEAHLVKGILQSYGIACEVRGEHLWSSRGMVPITTETAPTVWISESSDFDRAREIIQTYERRLSEEKSETVTWQCPSCGEISEVQFTECWNCGAQNPDYE